MFLLLAVLHLSHDLWRQVQRRRLAETLSTNLTMYVLVGYGAQFRYSHIWIDNKMMIPVLSSAKILENVPVGNVMNVNKYFALWSMNICNSLVLISRITWWLLSCSRYLELSSKLYTHSHKHFRHILEMSLVWYASCIDKVPRTGSMSDHAQFSYDNTQQIANMEKKYSQYEQK